MHKLLALSTAAVLTALLTACLVPERFSAAVDVQPDGSYSYRFDGTVVNALAVMKLRKQGVLSEKDHREPGRASTATEPRTRGQESRLQRQCPLCTGDCRPAQARRRPAIAGLVHRADRQERRDDDCRQATQGQGKERLCATGHHHEWQPESQPARQCRGTLAKRQAPHPRWALARTAGKSAA